MKVDKYDYPNPVLGKNRADYNSECKFCSHLDEERISYGWGYINYPFSYCLKCGGLERLLAEGHAQVVVRVRCVPTSYCKLFYFAPGQTSQVISVPGDDLVGRLRMQCLVISSGEYFGYTCDELNHEIFGDDRFDLEHGVTLAFDDIKYADIYSSARKNISSIFQVIKEEKSNRPYYPSFEQDRIGLVLNPEAYENYERCNINRKANESRYSACFLVLPALVEALGMIKAMNNGYMLPEDAEAMASRRWCRTLQAVLSDRRIDIKGESTSSIASNLLGDIISDCLWLANLSSNGQVEPGEGYLNEQ